MIIVDNLTQYEFLDFHHSELLSKLKAIRQKGDFLYYNEYRPVLDINISEGVYYTIFENGNYRYFLHKEDALEYFHNTLSSIDISILSMKNTVSTNDEYKQAWDEVGSEFYNYGIKKHRGKIFHYHIKNSMDSSDYVEIVELDLLRDTTNSIVSILKDSKDIYTIDPTVAKNNLYAYNFLSDVENIASSFCSFSDINEALSHISSHHILDRYEDIILSLEYDSILDLILSKSNSSRKLEDLLLNQRNIDRIANDYIKQYASRALYREIKGHIENEELMDSHPWSWVEAILDYDAVEESIFYHAAYLRKISQKYFIRYERRNLGDIYYEWGRNENAVAQMISSGNN